MSGRHAAPSIVERSSSVSSCAPSLVNAWFADAVLATVSTGGSHGRSTAVRSTLTDPPFVVRGADATARVGHPFGDGEHDDVVSGLGERGGQSVDVRRRATGGPRREVPREHEHTHGAAPYRR